MVFPEAPPLSTALAQLGAPQVSQQPLMSALSLESHGGSGGLMAAATAGGPGSLLGSGPGGPLMGGLGSSRGNASPQGLLSHPSDGAAPPRGGLAGGGLGRADVGSGSLMSTSSMREDSLIGQGSGAPEAGAEGASREQRPKRADSPSLHRVAKSASLKQDLQVRRRHAKTLDALMLGAERALGHRNSSGISSEALIEAFRGGGLLGSGGAQQAGGAAAGSQSGPEGMDLDG
eukprot:jgi/Astpho2/4826/Aster-07524